MAQIIPKILSSVEPHWQKELSEAFTRPEDLLTFVELEPKDYLHHSEARRLFPMRVPLPFAKLMEKGNPADPLLRQVLPLADEFQSAPGFSLDPLLEQDNPLAGLLHKYQSRVLLMVRTGCAVNCRYCFRRHFPYQDNQLSKHQWQPVLEYIAQHPEVNEVIYSGGDPLMAKDRSLAWLTEQLTLIPHIKRLRIHTRLPVVIPNRISDDLIGWLSNTPLQKVLVLHINHPQEISAELVGKLALLKNAGVTVLNQAVLLRGVNDNSQTLIDLSNGLFDAGVMPYYLHLLDKVKGAAHFDVTEVEARGLMAEVIKGLPGFLVPKLVREIGGQPGKTPIDLNLHN